MAYLRKGTAFYPSTVTAGTLGSGVTFPTGHCIQTKGDTLVSTSSFTIEPDSYLFSGLQIEDLFFKSTSNFFIASALLPGYYNGGAAGRAIKLGFTYTINAWTNQLVLGERKFCRIYDGYNHEAGDQFGNFSMTIYGQVPSTSGLMKIAVAAQAIDDDVLLWGNSASTDHSLGSLTVQEIQA